MLLRHNTTVASVGGIHSPELGPGVDLLRIHQVYINTYTENQNRQIADLSLAAKARWWLNGLESLL